MNTKFIIMVAFFSIMNSYGQEKVLNNYRTGEESYLYYNPQIGNAEYNDVKEN